jgi:predicted small metal-binding protein
MMSGSVTLRVRSVRYRRVDGMKQRKTVEFLKRPVVMLVFGLLIAGGLFFWYEYRPSAIRTNCSLEAEKRADNDEYVYEIIYRHCLRTHGIEYPEQKE